MNKETVKKIEGELPELSELSNEISKGFDQSIIVGCQKLIEWSSKYVMTDAPENEAFKKSAAERLSRLFGYCAVNEQPVSGHILIRILRESETDTKLMNALQYDSSEEYERSVNEVLYACLNFYCEIGDYFFDEDGQEKR